MDIRNVELLAPGGSPEGIRAAVHAGADAVYAGGVMFGARAYAENPDEKLLLELIDYCHLHGTKLYLTVNTLLKERELEGQLYDYVAPFAAQGIDAVLVQDFGVFRFLQRNFPDLPLHASTQMTVTGIDGVRLLKKMGAERVVLSRELSLQEIRAIRQETDTELEVFVHGALCYCYSGKCLMSSMIGGRSGNRGRCAQPCRLPYNGSNLLSLKDICMLDHLPDLIESGVSSLKIEGRMKSPAYAAGVTAIYRKYIDLYLKYGRGAYRVDPSDRKFLSDLFSRGDYSTGCSLVRNGRELLALKDRRKEKGEELKQAQESVKKIEEKYSTQPKIPVQGILTLKKDIPAELTVSFASQDSTRQCSDSDKIIQGAGNTRCVTLHGACPDSAKSRPLTLEEVKKQIEKTGDTPFFFSDLQIDMDEDLFLRMSDLNALRRIALDSLQEKIVSAYRRSLPGKGKTDRLDPIIKRGTKTDQTDSEITETASVCTREQLNAVLKCSRISSIYLAHSIADRKTVRSVRESGRKVYLMMPPVWREDTKQALSSIDYRIFDGCLLRSFDQFSHFHSMDLPDGYEIIADSCLYTWNKEARTALRELGAVRDTLPEELNERELRARGCEGSECIVYGRRELMVSAHCIEKTTGKCSHKFPIRSLTDRKGALFPVRMVCDICTNIIYNSVPLDLIDLTGQILQLGVSSVRYSFSVESADEAEQILQGRVAEPITRGHFRRGVE